METTHYWFIPKLMGWGFMPVTWEGWLASLVLIAMIAASIYVNGIFELPKSASITVLGSKPMVRFFLDLIVYIALFTLLFADKVEGGLQWRWF